MRILNKIIISFVALLSTTTQAKMIDCPSVEAIRKLAPLMTRAYDTGYSTYQVEISNRPDPGDPEGWLPWFIMSYNIAASSDDEAIEIAQKRAVNVSHMVYPNARKGGLRGDEYSCLYYDGSSPNPFVSVIATARNQ